MHNFDSGTGGVLTVLTGFLYSTSILTVCSAGVSLREATWVPSREVLMTMSKTQLEQIRLQSIHYEKADLAFLQFEFNDETRSPKDGAYS